MQRTVLLADENDSLVMHIRRALEEQEYRVIVARSTEETIIQIRSTTSDILILGNTLPGEGWVTVLRWLRHSEDTKSLPVIMLAADMADTDIISAWHEGIDSLQSKNVTALPVLTLELQIKITRIFRSLEEDNAQESDRVENRTLQTFDAELPTA